MADERIAAFAAQLAAAQGSGHAVLREAVIKESLTVGEAILLSEAQVRKFLSFWIMGLFGTVNIFMLGLIVWLATIDHGELLAGLIKPADRLVNAQVVMAMLGATTVQLGAIALIMTRFVFKSSVDAG